MTVTVQTSVKGSLQAVWGCWTNPEHIQNWNFASADWCCPKAQNNLEVGKRFSYRMEAKDGSFGFDFEGTYTAISPLQHISYVLDDERQVTVEFTQADDQVLVTETFDPENENPLELQQAGWQAILDNFKQHAESCR